jgi:hypothetical protein
MPDRMSHFSLRGVSLSKSLFYHTVGILWLWVGLGGALYGCRWAFWLSERRPTLERAMTHSCRRLDIKARALVSCELQTHWPPLQVRHWHTTQGFQLQSNWFSTSKKASILLDKTSHGEQTFTDHGQIFCHISRAHAGTQSDYLLFAQESFDRFSKLD